MWQTLDGVPDAQILGIEAARWTEFVKTRADVDYLAFPRLLATPKSAGPTPTATSTSTRRASPSTARA